MGDLANLFEERLDDIDAYVDFLSSVEEQIKNGSNLFADGKTKITVRHQQILYSSVYLQLYNLVESTIVLCLEAVTEKIKVSNLKPSDLSQPLRKEWVRFHAKTDEAYNSVNRLNSTLDMFDHLINGLKIVNFDIQKSSGGNWEDDKIEELKKRIGADFQIEKSIYSAAKEEKWFLSRQNCLKLIKTLRNELAHGSRSFRECGEGVTVYDLRDLKCRTGDYLREIVKGFESFIEQKQFLHPGNLHAGNVNDPE